MIRGFLRGLRAEKAGASAVEFALVAPLLFGLVIGTMNLGVYFFAQNSVSNALDEAARHAPLYPRPTTTDLQAIFDEALLKEEATGTVTLQSTPGSTASGIDYVDLSASYNVPVNFVFLTPNALAIPVSASRRVYLPQE